jgi:hypothetical protein
MGGICGFAEDRSSPSSTLDVDLTRKSSPIRKFIPDPSEPVRAGHCPGFA